MANLSDNFYFSKCFNCRLLHGLDLGEGHDKDDRR